MDRREGLIQVYTGDGKGKTTAALGQAVRALGQGFKVCYIYFHKNPAGWGYGELKILKQLGVETFEFAPRHPRFYGTSFAEAREECLKALEFITEIFSGNSYEVLILDEINISLRDGFLNEDDLVSPLEQKPPHLEIILTGRGAPKRIQEKAHLVSEIKKVKHPYDKGTKRRRGIEY